jgi:hypothetical protein
VSSQSSSSLVNIHYANTEIIMPSNWLVFDRIRALTRQHRIYRFERIFQDQSHLDRLTAGGDFLDFNNQAAILDQTNLQINRLERYKDYEQMDQTGEVSLALDLYADEACLAGDTHIPLLDGTCPTIAELAERGGEFWVYSFDQKLGEYVPAKAHGARVSGRDVPVVRVVLDDGSSVRCTSDHLFMMRDGEFREAADLQPGDSLKPFYKKRRYRDKGGAALFDDPPYPTATAYDYFFNGKNFTSVHRWVYHHFNVDQPEVVHHADFNSLNNIPLNLRGLTEVEHDAIHRLYGEDNHSFNHINWSEIVAIAETWHGPFTKAKFCEVCDIGDRVLDRLLRSAGISWSKFRDLYHRCSCCDERMTGAGWVCRRCRRAYLADYHQRRKSDTVYRDRRNRTKRQAYRHITDRVCSACGTTKPSAEFQKNGCAYSPYCNSCRPTVCEQRYIAKSFGNHKVIRVEPAGVIDKVYDIEVPEYHCFAAGTQSSWVIVHNSLVDPERKHTLIIRARNRRLKRELEELFFSTLQWDTYCRPSVRYLCKYGDMPFEVILDNNRTSVASLKFMNVYNFTRIETRHGDLIGFFYMDALWPRPQFLHPWQVIHLRLTSFENIYHPYGRAILDGGRKAFKQLRLMEDAALIYRITRAPEKRKFTIPVGLIPPKEVPEYMQMIARNFKRQRFYNPTTGTFDERYSPLIQEDDFFLPRRPDGTGPDVDVLPGGENVDKIADIEYFKKKMVAPMKIPFARVGIGEGAGEASEKSLSQSHSEFAKAVQWVQREVATGLTKIAIVHLALRGYSVDDLKGFEIALTATSAMEELYRIETWQTRVGVMADLKDLGWFPKEWIVTHFTDLSPDEIEELKEMETEATGGGPGGGGGGLGVPASPAAGAETGEGGEAETDPMAAGAEMMGMQQESRLKGYDWAGERRLLLEFKEQGRRRDALRIVQRWAQRLGKQFYAEDRELISGYQAILESKELDGLSSSSPPPSHDLNGTGDQLHIHDPNHDGGLLVEWSVPKVVRDEVIDEVYNVVTLGEQLPVSEDEEEITKADLPLAVSDL